MGQRCRVWEVVRWVGWSSVSCVRQAELGTGGCAGVSVQWTTLASLYFSQPAASSVPCCQKQSNQAQSWKTTSHTLTKCPLILPIPTPSNHSSCSWKLLFKAAHSMCRKIKTFWDYPSVDDPCIIEQEVILERRCCVISILQSCPAFWQIMSSPDAITKESKQFAEWTLQYVYVPEFHEPVAHGICPKPSKQWHQLL